MILPGLFQNSIQRDDGNAFESTDLQCRNCAVFCSRVGGVNADAKDPARFGDGNRFALIVHCNLFLLYAGHPQRLWATAIPRIALSLRTILVILNLPLLCNAETDNILSVSSGIWVMPGIFEDFEWWRDPDRGFKLVPAHEETFVPPTFRFRVVSKELMDVIEQDRTPISVHVATQIVRGSGKLQSYRPLKTYGENLLLQRFVPIQDDQGLLAFINEFGPLRFMGTLVSEFASDLLEQAQRARNLLRAYQKGDRRGLQRLIGTLNISHQISAYIVADRAGGRAQLQLKAPDLLSLIWIQVAVSISGGATIRECKLCGAWFEAGPKRDRRADSDFCSDEHKTQYHNANRAKRK